MPYWHPPYNALYCTIMALYYGQGYKLKKEPCGKDAVAGFQRAVLSDILRSER